MASAENTQASDMVVAGSATATRTTMATLCACPLAASGVADSSLGDITRAAVIATAAAGTANHAFMVIPKPEFEPSFQVNRIFRGKAEDFVVLPIL